jgi:hypothetical protein
MAVRKRDAGDPADMQTVTGNERTGRLDPAVGLILTVTAGYFLVVLKTALTNAEEAVRYEMPVYGLLILLLIFGVYSLTDRLASLRGSGKRYAVYISLFLATVILLLQISALAGDKVLFLYKDDSEGYRWAEDHHDATIVYIYNPIKRWMIWDDSTELLRYDRVYFVSADNEDGITDESILNEDEIYVYAVRSDEAYDMIEDLKEADANVSTITKVRELQYADIYEIR